MLDCLTMPLETQTRRILAFCFATIIILFSASVIQARSLSDIISSGVLRACVPTANPPDGEVIPEGCKGSCKYESVIGDLVETFAKELKVAPENYVQSWDELFHNVDGVTDKEGSYTPCTISIHSIAGDAAQQVELEISDEGPGVPEEVLPNLFSKSRKQAHAAGRQGIGLYLVNRRIRKLGGDLLYRRSSSNRTSFCITIPLARALSTNS